MNLKQLIFLPILLLVACTSAFGQVTATNKPADHVVRTLHGWTVKVDNRLINGDYVTVGNKALERLDKQLSDVALFVPADKLASLRKVMIWLDYNNGDLFSPQYHPSADWLKEHGFNTSMAKCVHIPDAKYYTGTRFQREQPFAILHELAHSYHDQVLGFDEPRILAAYNAIVKTGKYKSVLHVSGIMRPHYALTNEKEFFAEFTESYFGANDFYPFNSGELKRDEPELFNLLQNIWGPLP